MDRRKLITAKELELLWDRSSSTVDRILKKNKIDRIIQSCRKNEPIFYDRAECERARPFINQPEQKEVEKVGNVNSLETELDSEELASENGSAINDAELAAIITACKDPVDKIMILSALCFGVKSGELSYLDLRDISGADICLQSPSGVVKMRIPKQYEDARTELLTYYVDNGNNLSGDMPVFLNRSGIRMTRQGLNNRMKSVSESANIGRDVKLADLRATFAQNIYKKTEKNIASVHKYLRLSENTNIMGYLLETRSKEQKTMPVDLMNSLTASYQAKESPTIAEPTEQTPDIIPADTIDLFTMSELESELKNRGVELTAEVRAKINASDMPEMHHIAKMLRGNAKAITIRLSVLNEIAGELSEVNFVKCDDKRIDPKDLSQFHMPLSDIAESANMTKDKARYWLKLVDCGPSIKDRVDQYPIEAVEYLKDMQKHVKNGMVPIAAAAVVKNADKNQEKIHNKESVDEDFTYIRINKEQRRRLKIMAAENHSGITEQLHLMINSIWNLTYRK